MNPDAFDLMSAEEFTSSAAAPGTPAPAAKLLAATEDLFALDTRDWDSAHWQPSAIEWIEEDYA